MAGYCESLVRKYDYDRYISALFAPEAERQHLFALYAFNYEIARIAETVRNPMAGRLRLQWWRDAVDEIYSHAPGRTEVLKALADAIGAHALPKQLFDALLDARELDFEPAPFGNLATLETYADATSGSVMRFGGRIVGAEDMLDQQAREAGIAYAITGFLRALPFNAARGRIILPTDEMQKAGLEAAEILRGHTSDALSGLLVYLAQAARRRYSSVQDVERKFLPAILPAALVPGFLRIMTHRGFHPFRDSTEMPGYRRQWIMLRAIIRGKI
jgi:phytoene synthase